MKPIQQITDKHLRDIKLIVLDCDGVIVRRGTRIKTEIQENGNQMTTLETKTIAEEQIKQLAELINQGFMVNISSGRGLYMLQDMFANVLDYTSITFENGSATWLEGKIIQHINSHNFLIGLRRKLETSKVTRRPAFKGFEPKEFIITAHCHAEIDDIPCIVEEHSERVKEEMGTPLYCLWNGEAYDIGVKGIQTKAVGLKSLKEHLGLEKRNVLAIGDNLNDKELLEEAGIAVTADKSRVRGDFFVPLLGERLPAAVMIDQILDRVS